MSDGRDIARGFLEPVWAFREEQIYPDLFGDLGKGILKAVPNTEAIFWVDFSVLEVFPLAN